MEEIIELTKNKELIVRKKMSHFLEKLLRFYGKDIRHDLYKGIIYSEEQVRTEEEWKIKNFYDGLNYLLNNHMNPLSKELLKKFFYILYGKEFDELLLLRLCSKFFYLYESPALEKAIEYHLYVYEELKDFKEYERTIISLMFFNYVLVKEGIPCIHIFGRDVENYVKYRDEYFNNQKTNIYQLMYEIIKKNKFQDKSYYLNLRPIEVKKIYEVISNDKEKLQSKYRIRNMYIYGSFAKDKQRIDSDIDLVARFSLDLTYDEKKKISEELMNYYYEIFNRFVDIMEIGDYLNDEFIKEVTRIKKIF